MDAIAPCVYCEQCGDCLTCEPECWCEQQKRQHMEGLTAPLDEDVARVDD